DREAWDAYLEMRAALKKPMTPGAYHLTIAKLQSFEAQGLSSTEALNNSVENGWTGVFPPKQPNRPAGGATHGIRNAGRTDGNEEALRAALEQLNTIEGDRRLADTTGGDAEPSA